MKIPMSVDEIEKLVEKMWYEGIPGVLEPYTCEIDVRFGWAGEKEDRYWAESYLVKGPRGFGTGRAGMKMFLETGAPITKLTINGKDCTDRIEEFRQFILVNDKPFSV